MSHREWDVISEGLSNLIRDPLPKRNETQVVEKKILEEPSKVSRPDQTQGCGVYAADRQEIGREDLQ